MQYHLTYIFYLLFFLFSIIGHGLLFRKLFINKEINLNIGYTGIIGIFSISLFSLASSYFINHGYLHNLFLHGIGTIFFINFLLKKKSVKEIKGILLIFFIFLVGIYIFKNHDDFPYYHLTYALNLVENKFIIGSGIFGHGYRTPSSLFFFHSTLYLPIINFFLFNVGPFYILIFFNFIILKKIMKLIKKKPDIIFYLSLLIFSYVNIFFYRIAEHGVDKSPQILLFIIILDIIILFSHYKKKLNFNILQKYTLLILTLIFFAASIKQIYFLYFLLIPLLYFKINFFKEILNKNKLLIIILFASLLLNQLTSFFSTGCFLYPEEKTCFEKKIDWAIPKSEVKELKTHYSWWAKSGNSINLKNQIPKNEYINNLSWVNNWFDNYFLNKISDNIFGLLFLNIIFILFFYTKKKQKTNNINFKYLLYILLGFLLVWFFKHPALRYGGYVLIALPILIINSYFLTKFINSKKNITKKTFLIVVITIIIFNGRNIDRIYNEIDIYKYPIFEKPFFRVKETNFYKVISYNKLNIYANNNDMCWSTPTPCTYNPNLIVKEKYGFYIVKRKKIKDF